VAAPHITLGAKGRLQISPSFELLPTLDLLPLNFTLRLMSVNITWLIGTLETLNYCELLRQQCSSFVVERSRTLCERLQRLVVANLPFRPKKVAGGGQSKVQTVTTFLSLVEWQLLTAGLAISSTRHCLRASVSATDPNLNPFLSVLFSQSKTKRGVTARPLQFALRYSKRTSTLTLHIFGSSVNSSGVEVRLFAPSSTVIPRRVARLRALE
jgi:hypothetical protein